MARARALAAVCLAAQAALLLAAAAPHANVWEPALPTLLDSARTHVAIPLAGAVSAPQFFALYGHMTIGSPPQSFRVVFETGEDAVWIPNFHGSPTSTHAVYDHSKSQTYEPDGAGAIASGEGYSYFGFRSRDTLRFGGLTLANATFVEATLVPVPPNFDDLAIDGMFGLSPRLENNWVLAQLVRTGALAEPVFAFYLPRAHAQRPSNSSSTTDASSSVGELVIGVVDSRRFSGDVHYVDTMRSVRQTAWIIPLEAGTIGNTGNSERVVLVTEAAQAEIMASLPLIIGPIEDVARLAKAVGASGSTIDCAAPGPDVEIRIDGVAYVLTKDDYTLRDAGASETCRWAFHGIDLPGMWLFGQPFLQAVYTVFAFGDGSAPPRIGFAQAA